MSQTENAGPLSETHVRWLKIAVVVMGLMILTGLAAVIGRVIYLAGGAQRQAQTVAPASSRGAPARLALPAGATVRQVSLAGDRMAVHYDSPTGGGIAVVDVATGAVLQRIDLVPELPR